MEKISKVYIDLDLMPKKKSQTSKGLSENKSLNIPNYIFNRNSKCFR